MGILGSIRDKFPLTLKKKKKSIFLDSKGRYKTIIATGKTSGGGGVSAAPERSEKALKNYKTYYDGENTVFAAINTTAWNAIMVGYNLVSDDSKARLFIQRYLDALDLDAVLLDNVVYTLIYGDSFIEIVRNSSEDITDLKTVDPITMVVNYDKFGMVTGYQQKIQGQLQKTILKPGDIMHLKFFSNPSNPYGMSIIQPSMDTIDRKIQTDDALANAILRHGTSKYLVKVGTEEDIPDSEVFTDIKNELEDITSTNEFIVPALIDITTIDEKGVQGVEEYSSLFQTQLVIGMLCPEEALGLGKGSTEATATVKQIMYERFIRSIQFKLSTQIKNEIINPILEKNGFKKNIVKLRFNSVTDSDEAVKSKWLGNLLRGYPQGKHPFTINEVRSMFGYPPIKGGDVLSHTTPEEGDEKPEEEIEEPKPEEEEEEE